MSDEQQVPGTADGIGAESGGVHRAGFVALVGRPNVGKSTLTNALVGEKIAIVTNKPQTTRNRICAVVDRGECQFVFLDTPGLHKARTRLGDYMVNVVRESVADVDAVLLLVEPIPNIGAPEAELIARIKTLGCPSVLVINKVDTLEHNGVTYHALFPASQEDEESGEPVDVDADDEEYGLVIMKTVEENGEELLSTLDSDEEIEEIYNLFMERFFQEEDE